MFGLFGVFPQFAYVQLSSALLTVRDPKSGMSISERPDDEQILSQSFPATGRVLAG